MSAATDKVRKALAGGRKARPMEDVVALCPDLSWSEVFQAITLLSRSGEVRLSLDRRRGLRVAVVQPPTVE